MANPQPRLIINADDFGLTEVNNAGIIQAYRAGSVSSTSLVVGGEATAEAVALGHQHPGLAIGLHLALSDPLNKPALPPDQVTKLVDAHGRFFPDERNLRLALSTIAGRAQVRAEIAAQFAAFAATGLRCDHVNTHRHAHLHPWLALLIFRQAARCGVTRTRIPWDDAVSLYKPRDGLRFLRYVALRQCARYYHLELADRAFSRDWSTGELADFLLHLPDGVTELICHPVAAIDHQFARDLIVLRDERITRIISGLRLDSYETAMDVPAGSIRGTVCMPAT
jgi:chitin disaccharide deacetylase